VYSDLGIIFRVGQGVSDARDPPQDPYTSSAESSGDEWVPFQGRGKRRNMKCPWVAPRKNKS